MTNTTPDPSLDPVLEEYVMKNIIRSIDKTETRTIINKSIVSMKIYEVYICSVIYEKNSYSQEIYNEILVVNGHNVCSLSSNSLEKVFCLGVFVVCLCWGKANDIANAVKC